MPVYEVRITDREGNALLGAVPFIHAKDEASALATLTRTQRKRMTSITERVSTTKLREGVQHDGPLPFERGRRRR
jgi:hypothetical protein